MIRVRRLALALSAVPLALGLAACGKSDEGAGSGPSASPVASIAAPAGKVWSDVVAATPEGGMLMGNPNAPIKLVEYGSLSCPHCAKLSEDSKSELRDQFVNSGRVSFEFRSFAIHGIDLPLTVLARCAAPEAFFGLVEQVYANQNEILTKAQQNDAQAQAAAKLPPNQRFIGIAQAYGLTDWFAQRGVSVDQARTCLADPAAADRVAKEAQAASEKGINSTPTLQINGNTIQANTWDALKPELQRMGAR